MENIFLGHHLSKVFWMPKTGTKLPLAQEDEIKREKYTTAMTTHSAQLWHTQWP